MDNIHGNGPGVQDLPDLVRETGGALGVRRRDLCKVHFESSLKMKPQSPCAAPAG
jgi:hypothetical protein